MSKSVIEICNSALWKIGANRIVSLDDGSKEANACNDRFEPCKRAVLRMHPWNCAMKRATLAALSTTPEFGYSFECPLPSDFIRVFGVSPETEPDYRIEGKSILSDVESLDLKYVYDVTDLTKFDDLLCEAVAFYLAWDICYAITQSLQLKESMKQDMKAAISKARSADSQEEPTQELGAEYFLEARLGPVGATLTPKRNW